MNDELKARIEALLKSLGGTADEVADALRAKGIKGTRDDGCNCPIANLIKTVLPPAASGEWRDAGGGEPPSWFVDMSRITTPVGVVTTPTAVATFIETFDEGEWDAYADERIYPYGDLEAA